LVDARPGNFSYDGLLFALFGNSVHVGLMGGNRGLAFFQIERKEKGHGRMRSPWPFGM